MLHSYLFVSQVPLHMFEVVVQRSPIAVEIGVLLSGFVTEGNISAIGVKEDAVWHSPVPSIVKLQYGGIHFAWIW